MWFKLAAANFSAKNLGKMADISNSYSINYNISGFTKTVAPPSVTKGETISEITLTLQENYEMDSTATLSYGSTSVNATVSGSTYKWTNITPTGSVTITAKATWVGTGEEPGGGVEDDAPTVVGFTAQPLSLNTSNWVRSTVGTTGSDSVADGTSTTRLTYNQVFTAPLSGRIKVTCADNFQWGIRSGVSETSMVNNQYWLNNGDELQLATSATKDCKFMLIFRKINGAAEPPFARKADPSVVAITKDDITTMNPALYFADNYSVAFDVSDYKFIFAPDTDTSKWLLATVSTDGIGADGSRQDRLTYNIVLDGTQLQESQVIGVTCAEGYQWAVRVSNDNGVSYPNNCYWYDSGTFIRVGYAGTSPSSTPSATNYILVFRKYKNVGGGTATSNENQFTGKEEAAALNAKVYTAQGY